MDYLEERILASEFECSNDKRNILLIGDSIREGYCAIVKEQLSDIANVFYMRENNQNTQYVITRLREYCSKFDFPELVDVVHFNCGHWDIAHWNGSEVSLTSIQEYAKNLNVIISLIKELFINATIVFATTTPMNPNGEMGINFRTNKEIAEYNAIARTICIKNSILFNDLNDFVKNWGCESFKDYCHFTESANVVLGKNVAERLKSILMDKVASNG